MRIVNFNDGYSSSAAPTSGQSLFTLANTQSATNVTGLLLDHTVNTSVTVECEINRTTGSGDLVATGQLRCLWRAHAAAWDIIPVLDGDINGSGAPAGVTFTITSGGQIQYATDTLSGTSYVGTLKYRTVGFTV